MFKKNTKKSFYFCMIIIIILCSIPFPFAFAKNSLNANKQTNSFPVISSRAYAILDRDSGKLLLGKSENTIKKMASTTKIMTAILILENCHLQDIVTVSQKASSIGGSKIGLKKGDKITVENLLYGLLVYSGNDTAIALAEHLGGTVDGFSKIMNEKASSLGLINTNFVTPHGLDADNHYTTAYELALLTNYALENKTFTQMVSTKSITITINNYPKQIKNTNALLGSLNGVYGVKTGFTNGAYKCLVTACKRNNLDIICVVLGSDTSKIRIDDTTNLLEYTFSNFKKINLQNLFDSQFNSFLEQKKNAINVSKSKHNNLELYIKHLDCAIIPLNKADIPNLKVHCCFSNNFEAPLKEGAYIGSIYISLNNTLISSSPIHLANEVNKKDILSNFIELVSIIREFFNT